MKCPKCGREMEPDRWGPENTLHGYTCDFCEMYFTTLVLEAGVFDKDENSSQV